jgi:hypothetical protein
VIARRRCHRERPGSPPPSRPLAPTTAWATWFGEPTPTSVTLPDRSWFAARCPPMATSTAPPLCDCISTTASGTASAAARRRRRQAGVPERRWGMAPGDPHPRCWLRAHARGPRPNRRPSIRTFLPAGGLRQLRCAPARRQASRAGGAEPTDRPPRRRNGGPDRTDWGGRQAERA